MHRPFRFVTGFVTLMIALPCAAQEPKKTTGTITTIGSATVQVQPDTVRITFGHQVKLATLKEARAESDRQVGKISDGIKALKIEGLNISTTTNNVQAFLSSNPGGAAPVADMPLVATGYQVTTWFTVTAKSTEIDKMRDIAKRVGDAGLENGANLSANMNSFRDFGGGGGIGGPGGRALTRSFSPGVEIFREDMTDATNKALGAAVKNALGKAQALALGANSKIHKIVAISDDIETQGPQEPRYYDDYSPFGGPRPEPAPTAKTSLTVRVRVMCSFE